MFTVITHKQKNTYDVDAMEFIQMLNNNGLHHLSAALLSHVNIENLPAVSYLLHSYDMVGEEINFYDYEYFRSVNIIKLFTEQVKQSISVPYHIPKYNLAHIGQICHLNSCISMLSSMTILIKEMNYLKNVSQPFKTINQYILNSYSEVDLHLNLIKELMDYLKLNFSYFEEATETMKKILRILYKNGINKSTVFYWDSTDEFHNTNGKLGSKIYHFKPKYLLVNVHDLNSLLDYDTHKVKIRTFNVKECRYKLLSLISYYPGHFVSMFYMDDGRNVWKIINDLNDRFKEEYSITESIFTDDGSHVLACYLLEE